MSPNPRCKRIHLHKSRMWLHRQKNPWMTEEDKVAVEDAGTVEDQGRINGRESRVHRGR
jgi:translation initiation factor IF-1